MAVEVPKKETGFRFSNHIVAFGERFILEHPLLVINNAADFLRVIRDKIAQSLHGRNEGSPQEAIETLRCTMGNHHLASSISLEEFSRRNPGDEM